VLPERTAARVKLRLASGVENARSNDSSVFVTAGSAKKTLGGDVGVVEAPVTLQMTGEAPPLIETNVMPNEDRYPEASVHVPGAKVTESKLRTCCGFRKF
jgi:hypothetical protein